MPVPEVPNSNGVSVEVSAEADGMQVQIVDLEPNGVIGLHTHARPQAVVIVAGSGTETASGKTYSQGDHALFDAHQAHGWRNNSDAKFSFASISAGPGLLNTARGAWDITPA